jgi:hypothetical protein
MIKDCIQEKYGNVDFKFSNEILGRNKTGLKDKIPEVKEELELKEENELKAIPEIKLKIDDVKIKPRKSELFGGF